MAELVDVLGVSQLLESAAPIIDPVSTVRSTI